MGKASSKSVEESKLTGKPSSAQPVRFASNQVKKSAFRIIFCLFLNRRQSADTSLIESGDKMTAKPTDRSTPSAKRKSMDDSQQDSFNMDEIRRKVLEIEKAKQSVLNSDRDMTMRNMFATTAKTFRALNSNEQRSKLPVRGISDVIRSKQLALFDVNRWTEAEFCLHTIDSRENSLLHNLIIEREREICGYQVDRIYILESYCARLRRHNYGVPVLLNRRNQNGETPLYLAVRENLRDLVECLLEFGSDPLFPCTSDNRTALHCAVLIGESHLEPIKVLLRHSQRDMRMLQQFLAAVDVHGWDALTMAIMFHDPQFRKMYPVAELLIDAGAAPPQLDRQFYEGLHSDMKYLLNLKFGCFPPQLHSSLPPPPSYDQINDQNEYPFL